jgi:membrane protein implicated in regulation of membrane protease activity
MIDRKIKAASPDQPSRVINVAWLVWVVVAALLAIGELLTPGLFFLGPVALAAAAAALAAALGAGDVAGVLVFLVGAVLSLALLRPIARRHVRLPALSRTGTDALVGRRAVVTRTVDAAGGRVRIGGEEWSARSYLDGEVYAEGATVDVVRIDGATALVAE